jgi:glycosyltransferase involved in cell wall biosynthesis
LASVPKAPLDPSASLRHNVQLLMPGVPSTPGTGATSPHVLLALDQFPRALGGGERVALTIASLLPHYGYRVSILALGVDPESAILRTPPPCPIYLLPLSRTWGREAFTAAIELRRFLRDQQIAIVQTFFESSDLWTGPVAKLFSGTKLVWSRRDMGILRQRKHSIAYRLMARMPDKVFAVSEQVRNYTIEVDRVPATRVETLYNGLDLTRWSTAIGPAVDPQSPVIVTVGNIRRVKGHDVFLRAAAIVAGKFPAARFRIAGEVLEPDFFAELQSLVQQLGIVDRISFTGGVSDLSGFLRDATLFVLPSRSEGFSNAIIEAMAAGLPVIATNVGGNAEAVADHVTGRIVPAEDVDALASAMLTMLENPERARAMGHAGRLRVGERFTTEAMMKQLTTAYRGLLAGKKGSTAP